MIIALNFIRNGVDLFQPCATVGMTIQKSMRFWGHCSVLRDGQSRKELNENNLTLEGAHLYRCGSVLWLHLRKLPANIFPIDSNSHANWDNHKGIVRPVYEKTEMLIQYCTSENTLLIMEIVKRLSEMAKQ